eukprot:UN20781
MLRLLPNRRLVGSQGLKGKRKNTPNVDACAEIHFQMKIFRLKRLYQPQTKLAFLQIQSSSSALQVLSSSSTLIFKLHSSNYIFKLHSSNSIFNFNLSALLSPNCSISSY